MNNFTKKAKVLAASAISTLTIFSTVAVAHAQTGLRSLNDNLGKIGTNAGLGTQQELPVLIGSIISVLLGFLGVVIVLIIIYAGFLWMTAQGDKAKVEKAKTMISQAVVGLIIIFAAYSITSFVIKNIGLATKVETGIM